MKFISKNSNLTLWDNKNNKPLVTFKKGEFETEEQSLIALLKSNKNVEVKNTEFKKVEYDLNEELSKFKAENSKLQEENKKLKAENGKLKKG